MKNLSYIGLSSEGALHCDNLVLMCMDFRFHKRLSEALAFEGYRDYDLLAVPGASKAVRYSVTREVILDSVKVAVAAHDIKLLIIVDHVDCKTYGGSEAFATPEDEMEMHRGTLREASEIVKTRFPDLKTLTLYAAWDRLVVLE